MHFIKYLLVIYHFTCFVVFPDNLTIHRKCHLAGYHDVTVIHSHREKLDEVKFIICIQFLILQSAEETLCLKVSQYPVSSS